MKPKLLIENKHQIECYGDWGFENKQKRYTKAILPEGPQKIKGSITY
jgi:hypothetical protein